MWDPPRPGLEPVSPALAGRFSTTAPPGKPQMFYIFYIKRSDAQLNVTADSSNPYISLFFLKTSYLLWSWRQKRFVFVFVFCHFSFSTTKVNIFCLNLRKYWRLQLLLFIKMHLACIFPHWSGIWPWKTLRPNSQTRFKARLCFFSPILCYFFLIQAASLLYYFDCFYLWLILLISFPNFLFFLLLL